MTNIFVVYSADRKQLPELAMRRGAQIIPRTTKAFDRLADETDGTLGPAPAIATGAPGWVALAAADT